MKVTTRQLRRIIRERLEAGLSDRDLQYAREDEELGPGRDEWEDVSDRDLQGSREDEDPAARAWRDGDPFEAGHIDGYSGKEPTHPDDKEYLAGYESGSSVR